MSYKIAATIATILWITSTVASRAQAATINLDIDASQNINSFSNEMTGISFANWEHSWNKYFPGQVPDLAKVIKAANIRLIRYAGGLWSNWVMWERSPQKTPFGAYNPDQTYYDTQYSNQIDTSNDYSFHYGINEINSLAALAQSTNANVIIQTNIHHDDPYMWADLVKYAKDQEYPFKYWELGNEFDHDPLISPEEYKSRLGRYIDIMKSADSSIQIIGGVAASAHDSYRTGDWSQTTLSTYLHKAAEATSPTNKKIDSLSWHWYQGFNMHNQTPTALTQAMHVFTWNTDPNYINESYARKWSQIAPFRVQTEIIDPISTNITQGISELNMDACDNVEPCNTTSYHNANHMNAVWMSDVLGRLAYNGIDYVTWYTGYGNQGQGYPTIFSTNDYYPSTIYLRPNYYVLFLYGNYFGDQMVETNTPNDQDVSIWASTDSNDPGKLKIIVNNLSSQNYTTNISVSGKTLVSGKKYTITSTADLIYMFTANGIGNNNADHKTRINGYELTSQNIENAVNEITPQMVNIAGATITETLTPYSITAFVIDTNESPSPIPTASSAPIGDTDDDSDVDFIDLLTVVSQFDLPGTADFNLSGVVDIFDLTILMSNFGI